MAPPARQACFLNTSPWKQTPASAENQLTPGQGGRRTREHLPVSQRVKGSQVRGRPGGLPRDHGDDRTTSRSAQQPTSPNEPKDDLSDGWRAVRLPRWCSGKESACQAGDVGSTPGSGRPPGGGNGSFQYSRLENPMDRGAWRATAHGVQESVTTQRLNRAEHKFINECIRKGSSFSQERANG